MALSGTYSLLLVFGAAALLLWGTRMVRTGVMRAFGSEMRRILSAGLANRLVAAATGALAAGSLQSATAVALLVASFARAGSMGVALGLALMLGADVGSAVVASLLTLDIKRFWPIFIFAGYVLHTAYDGRSARGKQTGRILLGVGLILLALNSMGALSADLSQSQVILTLVAALVGEPLVAVLLLALLTWLAHSSIAMLLFVASLAAAGVLTDPGLIVAMVLGVNIGGAMPAIMMTLAEPPEARRITVGNGLFRLTGGIVGLLLLPWLAAVYSLLPGDAGFRTVATHILLNLALVAAFLPLIHPIERLLERVIRARESREEAFGPLYLSSAPSDLIPSLALNSVLRETLRMIDLVDAMLRQAFEILTTGDRARTPDVHRLDDQIDTLYEAIKAYTTDLTRQDHLEVDESRRAIDVLSYATSLENAGDVIDKSLLDIVEKKIKSSTTFSQEGEVEIRRLYDFVVETNRLAAAVTMNWQVDDACKLLQRKRTFKRLVSKSSERHLDRLRRGEARSLETSSFHLDIIGDLQRINSLLSGIAYSVVNAAKDAGESTLSR